MAKALGWRPGPQVGRMLERLREAQALGEIHDAEMALILARQLLETEGLP